MEKNRWGLSVDRSQVELEVLNFTRRARKGLRVQYNNNLRMLIRLPKHCSASNLFAEVQTDDLVAIRCKRVESLLRRVCGNGNNPFRVMSEKLDWLKQIYQLKVVVRVLFFIFLIFF